MTRTLVLAAVAMALLSSCKTRQEFAVTFDSEGAGRFAVRQGLDVAAREAIEQTGIGTGADEPVPDPDDLPPGMTVEPWSEDGFTGHALVASFASPGELEAILGDVFASTRGRASAPRVEQHGDQLEIEIATAEAVGEVVDEVVDASGAGRTGTGGDPPLSTRLGDVLELRFVLDVPGAVLEHNADLVDGRRLVWRLLPPSDRPVRARFRLADHATDAGGNAGGGTRRPHPGWWIGGTGGTVAALVLLARRRHRPLAARLARHPST